MNIQQLRQSLKLKWVSYYYNNHSWLEKMRVWGTYDGQRRPSSSFILATLSVLEPQLEQIFPFILELNNDPDQIVAALGLNFNPEEELDLLESSNSVAENEVKSESPDQMLPEHQPLTPSVVVTEVENNTKPLASVAVTPEVPLQTLSECKPLTLSAIASEAESQSQSVQSGAFAATQVESKSNPMVGVFFSSKVGSKSKPRSLVTVTSSQVESKSKPVSLLAVITREMESKAVQSVAFATQVESKGRLVRTLQKDIHNQVNSPPDSKYRNLSNWIDDFCQGVGCDREERSFIP
ncbi:DUF5331 domain-containing protein [Mastigocladopsis repens]|uniref:DUF5331 domain-containing protein n=1 Tax=Mastigocladopsis repens TaxID=221287 RepID=UPI00031AEC09|nr:DUF5331 domain-containing protein [Mastigocladopsis repens]